MISDCGTYQRNKAECKMSVRGMTDLRRLMMMNDDSANTGCTAYIYVTFLHFYIMRRAACVCDSRFDFTLSFF